MSRKQCCLVLMIALLAAVFLVTPGPFAQNVRDGHQWSQADMSTKRLICMDHIKQHVGASVWMSSNRRAAATFYCMQRIDQYYEEHPKDDLLAQAMSESVEDVARFLKTGERE